MLERTGFAILLEFDVRKILKEKFDVNYADYSILSVSDSIFTLEILRDEKELRILPLGNVIVFEKDE